MIVRAAVSTPMTWKFEGPPTDVASTLPDASHNSAAVFVPPPSMPMTNRLLVIDE
jgi:hypothetical protein